MTDIAPLSAPAWLKRSGSPDLAYRLTKTKAGKPTLVFCPGYRSDMISTKASVTEHWCQQQGYGCLRFDYQGHGESCGEFEVGTISTWTNDTLDIIDKITEGSLVLVGSSMGGWIALNAAIRRRDRIKAMVLIAPAPDFTRDLFWAEFPQSVKDQLEKDGYVELPNDYSDEPYHVSKALIDDGDTHALLKSDIAFDGPVRILHGQQDAAVPWERSLTLANCLTSQDVRITYVKGADHRLSEPPELELLCTTYAEILTNLNL